MINKTEEILLELSQLNAIKLQKEQGRNPKGIVSTQVLGLLKAIAQLIDHTKIKVEEKNE